MQAAVYERTGAAREVLQLVELPDPQPGPGEVRVRLRWSGVNPSDVKTRAGLRSAAMSYPLVVPHSDGMGVIDRVGPGVAEARIGERVWTWNAARGRAHGTAAQFITLPAAQAVRLPDGVADEAGACLGIPALTALHAVLTGGGVEGRRVLVHGGAGAVGHYAVQFARLLGARQVLATASTPEKAAIARAAGAEAVVDYRSDTAAGEIRAAAGGAGVDRVIELDLARNAELDAAVLVPGGECVIYGSSDDRPAIPYFRFLAGNTVLRFFLVYHLADQDRRRAEAELGRLLEAGALEHRIAERLPLDRIAEAHERVEQGRAVGNVVLALP